MDLARPMMDKLIEKAGGRATFPVLQADATRMPFVDGAFGAAYLRWVLHLIPDWRAALAEAVRVVGRGGAVLVLLGAASKTTSRRSGPVRRGSRGPVRACGVEVGRLRGVGRRDGGARRERARPPDVHGGRARRARCVPRRHRETPILLDVEGSRRREVRARRHGGPALRGRVVSAPSSACRARSTRWSGARTTCRRAGERFRLVRPGGRALRTKRDALPLEASRATVALLSRSPRAPALPR